MGLLKTQFRPEFLNRVDEIISFKGLEEEDLLKIVDIQLSYVNKRIEDNRMKLNVSLGARKLLAQLGYDQNFGARPLKRVIQKQILDKLSLEILSGKFKEGSTINISENKGELSIE